MAGLVREDFLKDLLCIFATINRDKHLISASLAAPQVGVNVSVKLDSSSKRRFITVFFEHLCVNKYSEFLVFVPRTDKN